MKMEQERYELPDEWEWKQIGELFEVTSSKRVHQKDWKSEGIPFYRTRELVELSKNGHVDNTLFISNEMFNEFKNKYGIPSENDLLVSGVGTIGIPYIVPKNNQFYFKDGNIIWFKNKKNTNAKFIYFLYHSPFVIRQINAFPVGTTVKTYTIVNAKNTWIPLPPLPEQRRIADKLDAVLGRIDDAIRLSQDNLASLDDLFASMLQQAFNPLGKTSKETRYELPDGWEWKKLSVIAPPSRQTLLPVSDQQYNYIGLEHIVPNSAKLTDFSPVDGQTIASTKNIFSRNMVLFGKLRPYLRKVHVAQFDGIASTEIIPFQCTADILPEYLAHFMRSDFFINLAVDNCSGSRMPRVTTRFLQTLAFIPLPPLPEQRRIADKLDALSGKIALQKRAIEEKLDELNHLKSSVLDAAFRGRL